MRQDEAYRILREHGPMTVGQLLRVAYPDASEYRIASMRSNAWARLHQLSVKGQVGYSSRSCGTENLWWVVE